MKKTLLSFLLIITMHLSYGGGYQVNLQGHRALGMGHCATGILHGPSSLFFNPGAFAFLDSSNIQLNAHFIFVNTQYRGVFPSAYTTETVPGLGTPFSFYANYRPKGSRLNFGLGVYTPFGSSIGYNEDWIGSAVIQSMSLQTIFVQPTVGFQINEKLGIGVGYVFGTGNFELKKAVPVEDASGTYGQGTLIGSAIGHGFNVGLFYNATESVSIGINYRSGVAVTEEDGDAIFDVPAGVAEFFPSTTFAAELNMPSTLSFGLSYRLNDKVRLALDVNYVGWSVYDTLAFDFATNTEKLEDIASPRKYGNSSIIRFGGEYKASDKLTARAGVYYDFTPVADAYITPETPDSDKLGLSAGITYQTNSGLAIDASFLFVEGKERTAVNSETNFGGTWKSRGFVPGIGLTYSF